MVGQPRLADNLGGLLELTGKYVYQHILAKLRCTSSSASLSRKGNSRIAVIVLLVLVLLPERLAVKVKAVPLSGSRLSISANPRWRCKSEAYVYLEVESLVLGPDPLMFDSIRRLWWKTKQRVRKRREDGSLKGWQQARHGLEDHEPSMKASPKHLTIILVCVLSAIAGLLLAAMLRKADCQSSISANRLKTDLSLLCR